MGANVCKEQQRRVQITKDDKIGCLVDKKTFKPLKSLLIKRVWRQKIILGIHFHFSSLIVTLFFPTTLTKGPEGEEFCSMPSIIKGSIPEYPISGCGERNSSLLECEHKPPLSDEKNFLRDL